MSRELSVRERQIALLGSWNQVGHVIHVLAELGIADHIADGPLPVAELAGATGSHADALYRVLRCAAALDIVEEDEKGRFSLTPVGEGLKSAQLGGLRPMVQLSSAEYVRKAYADILHSVRTGEPAFDHVYGTSFYQYLEEHPEAGEFFGGFMAHWSRRLGDRFAEQLDLGRFDRIADVGGGDGYFLARSLEELPGVEGELFELPAVADRARDLLKTHALQDRVTVSEGDFFTDPLPPGCGAYILKSVLHDWGDPQAEAILHRIRAVAESDARVIIIDQIVPPANEWDHSKIIDIDMLVLRGGRERSLAEWQRLFAATGLELVNTPTTGWTVLECRPSVPSI